MHDRAPLPLMLKTIMVVEASSSVPVSEEDIPPCRSAVYRSTYSSFRQILFAVQ